MKRAIAILIFVSIMAALGAQAQNFDPLLTSPEEAFRQGKQYLNAGQARQAIDLLSKAVKAYPESGPLARLLASAYLADNNEFWAQKVLMDHAAGTQDCMTLSWIAWIHLKNGELDQAEMILQPGDGGQPCMKQGPTGARWHLLCSMLLYLQDKREQALDHLQKVYPAKRLYPEDRVLFSWLRKRLDKGYIEPVSFRIDQAVGWNSNSLFSSAAEVRGNETEVESWLILNEHDIRVLAPLSRVVRPVLEYNGRVKYFFEEGATDVGFYQPSGRIGLLLGDMVPRLGLYYANEDLLYFGKDRYQEAPPRWFYEAHRGEFEYEILSRLLFFGGLGKRFFRERARTRMEYDLGLAGSIPIYQGTSLTLIGTGRSYDSKVSGYDAAGTSELLVLTIPYYRDGTIRIGGTFSYDDYPASAEYYQAEENRQDTQYRFIPAIWSPSVAGFRAGITYEYTDRTSSIEAYDYDVHEALFHIGWWGNFDPWKPKAFLPAGYQALDYGLEKQAGYEERMQDLLRQEDAAQRSSSCVD